MADTVPMRSRLRAMPGSAWVLFGGMFLNKFGNFLNVFLVLFLVAKGYSTAEAGAALAVVGIGAFVGNIAGGVVADRFGRRTAIVISMAGASLATACVPFTGSLVATTALVGLVGVFAQLYRPAAGALLVDTVPEELRVTAFAVLRLAINVGMAVGPMVGAVLSAYSFTYVFYGDALTSLAFAVLALTALPGGRPPAAPDTSAVPDTSPADAPASVPASERDGYRVVFADRPYLFFLASMTAATFVYSQATATLPLHIADAHLGTKVYGLMLGLNAVLCVLIELPLTRWTERLNPRRVIATGLLLLGAGMAATGLSSTVWLLTLTVVVWTVAETVYTPIANAYPAEFAPAHLRGRYQGAEGLAHTLGNTLGPAVGGLLYGLSTALHWTSCAAVAAAGALLVLAARARTTPAAISAAASAPEPAPESAELADASA
ncbi:MDR family MFS transporter [Actinacidiphila yeochonensis]|uniref:MDR family MFS transporter n=1 Tax=Actinacidiphila yeochonensis TaxID=89050 RepID=UPI00068EDB32|nr:MFS transporter [Actinacidiphila yeochonensis]